MNRAHSRRSALRKLASASVVTAAATTSLQTRLAAADQAAGSALKGRVNHSVCKWCYSKVDLEPLCVAGKAMGLQSVELLEVKDFPTLKKHGLSCAMVSGVPGGITEGLNRTENHEKIAAFYEQTAPIVAQAGFKNII